MNNKRMYNIIWAGDATHRSGLPVISSVYVLGSVERDNFVRSIQKLDSTPIVNVASTSVRTFRG